MTAAYQATLDGRKRIIEQMVQIRKLLDVHIVMAENNKEDWGYSGDMEHVSSQLSEIEEGLSYLKEFVK